MEVLRGGGGSYERGNPVAGPGSRAVRQSDRYREREGEREGERRSQLGRARVPCELDSSARRGGVNLFVSVIKISTPGSPPPLAPL